MLSTASESAPIRVAIVPFASLAIGARVGSGAFGEVYEAALNDGTEVAVKVGATATIDATAIENERQLLSRLPPHRNVVVVYAICLDHPSGGMAVVMELYRLGSLLPVLKATSAVSAQ